MTEAGQERKSVRCETCRYQVLPDTCYPCCDCANFDQWEARDDDRGMQPRVYCHDYGNCLGARKYTSRAEAEAAAELALRNGPHTECTVRRVL